VNSSGTTAFNGIIGGATAPTTVTTDAGSAGGVTLGANITTGGVLTLNEAATLGANVTITTSNGNVVFGSTINGAQTLTIAQGTGTVTFTGAVGGTTALTSVTVSGAGSGTGVTVSGGQVTTSGVQSYTPKVTLGANATFTGTTPTFTGGIDGSGSNYEVTLNFSGPTTVGGTNSVGGALFVNLGKLTTGDTAGGTTIIGDIILAGGSRVMTFNDNVTFSGNSTLTSTDIHFAGTVSAASNNVTLAGSGTTTLASTYTSTGGTLTSNGGGTTVLTGSVYTAAGAQTYSADTVRLAADVTLTSSDATTGITLGAVQGTGDGTEGLAIAGKAVIAAGGVGTTSGKRLQYLTVTGTTSLNASVTTAEHQTYTGAVTLPAATSDPVLTGTTPTFTDGVPNANGSDLTLNFSGTTAIVGANFGNTTAIAALTTGGGGTTTIDGTTALTTTGAQVYNDAVQLVANSTLASGATAITFNSTLDSSTSTARTLTISASGTQTFAGAVGSTYALGALDTSTGGITISGGSINTGAANQTYDGSITLGANATLTGGNLTLATAGVGAGAGFDLTLNFSGTQTSLGAGAAITGVKNLTTGGGGTTTINGNITTTGTQTYNDAVVVSAAVTLASTPGTGSANNITFNSTINGDADNTRSLTVNTSGTTTFAGSIGLGANGVFDGGGDDRRLLALTTDAGTASGTTISGGTIFATTATFGDTVTVGGGTVIKGTTHSFNNATAILGGGNSLTLSGTGVTTIGGNVSNLSSITRDAGTTTAFASSASSISVTTTGAQFWGGGNFNLTGLGAAVTLTLTGSSVTVVDPAISAAGSYTEDSKTITVNFVP